ncbi:hypothetical protein L1S32_00200 [Methanogenium sp. S4BF]|uniref:hypothetical protein n=1 Tax=Methanogenium sp. S4BF TaxID=1789226 RepID=UPI002416E027|nr:hypothetical protein [Methanogenium sp. S4BF]WFN34578.1 hypothetical protein L1S32_00200 [Methanogenium sp. S4BF]
MGMDFEIQKSDGTREYVTMMSYGSFSDIIRVGETLGLGMDEYESIVEYSGLDEEKVIQLEDVQKLLPFYRKMLKQLEELDRKGIILLTETDEQRRRREMNRCGTTPRHRWEGAKSHLHQLIDLCERTIQSGGSIVMVI